MQLEHPFARSQPVHPRERAHHPREPPRPPQAAAVEDGCPEYTLVTDKVVFLIVGKSSGQLVPLAEIIDFRVANKELAVRVNDARKEAKFSIKEMTLRAEWDLLQKHIEQELTDPARQPLDTSLALRTRQ